jgi:hypothetical protein
LSWRLIAGRNVRAAELEGTVQQERRRKQNARAKGLGWVSLTITDPAGRVHRTTGRAADYSGEGIGLTVSEPVVIGSTVVLDGQIATSNGDHSVRGSARVRWCTALPQAGYRVGLLLEREEPRSAPGDSSSNREQQRPQTSPPPGEASDDADHYERLQLSPGADQDTINKVFRILAARYHPDNAETGNSELFRRLVEAHEVLSDPERRAAYDSVCLLNRKVRWRVFENASVTAGAAAEKRKRTGVLSLLYTKRCQEPDQPALALRDFEELMGCPKEHLEFTMWYLKESGFVTRGDNGRYQITVKGVDHAESQPGVVVADATHLLGPARS